MLAQPSTFHTAHNKRLIIIQSSSLCCVSQFMKCFMVHFKVFRFCVRRRLLSNKQPSPFKIQNCMSLYPFTFFFTREYDTNSHNITRGPSGLNGAWFGSNSTFLKMCQSHFSNLVQAAAAARCASEPVTALHRIVTIPLVTCRA